MLIEYPNVLPIFATLISKKMATLHELRTIYSYGDCLDMMEIITVDNYNEYMINKYYETKSK